MKHLGRRYHDFLGAHCLEDDPLLQDGHDLGSRFDRKISARHHNSIGGIEDVAEIIHGLGLFYLCNQERPASKFPDQISRLSAVGGAADEGQRHQVHAALDAKLQVGNVLFRNRRDGDVGAGQVDSLTLSQRSAVNNARADVAELGVHDFEHNFAVVDEDAVSRMDLLRQPGITGREPARVPFDVFPCNANLGAVLEDGYAAA